MGVSQLDAQRRLSRESARNFPRSNIPTVQSLYPDKHFAAADFGTPELSSGGKANAASDLAAFALLTVAYTVAGASGGGEAVAFAVTPDAIARMTNAASRLGE